ncbi:hypothetical protein SNEBB_005228 [Seison nebaliae]|nr:hypothetical protein SNEBB_005228 [Seison nebaliae]
MGCGKSTPIHPRETRDSDLPTDEEQIGEQSVVDQLRESMAMRTSTKHGGEADDGELDITTANLQYKRDSDDSEYEEDLRRLSAEIDDEKLQYETALRAKEMKKVKDEMSELEKYGDIDDFLSGTETVPKIKNTKTVAEEIGINYTKSELRIMKEVEELYNI